jgi:hypothetical protein
MDIAHKCEFYKVQALIIVQHGGVAPKSLVAACISKQKICVMLPNKTQLQDNAAQTCRRFTGIKMILHAINLGLLTLLFFVVGMIKPQWALFFMQKPSRWIVTMVTTVFVMIVMTMYGEGMRQQKIKEKHMKQPAATAAPVPVPVPEVAPVPVPTEKPKETAVKKK